MLTADRCQLRVSACPHPFEQRRVDYAVPAGLTIAEIVEIIQPDPVLRQYGVAFTGEMAIPRQFWHRVRPKPDTYLSIRLLPAGGGGMGRLLATVGVMVLSLAATAFGGPIAGMAVSLVGNLALSLLMPPPKPQLSKNYGTTSPTYAITGARNRSDPWGKLPFL